MIKLNKKGLSSSKGFTLIELLVVIAIIGLLSTLAVVSLNNARSKARDARRTADLKTIQSAIELYKGDNASSDIFAVAATWAEMGATGGALATYLPGGMPLDPTNSGSQVYNLCTQTATLDNYLLTATLENAASVVGGSRGLISGWVNGDCRNSLNAAAVTVGTCSDAVSPGLFCLGDISK